MATTPCIPVPSPQHIQNKLFPKGPVNPVSLPSIWKAGALFTPFGGLNNSPTNPGDQLVVGNVTYDASDSGNRLMRVGLYTLESLQYCDLMFKTSDGKTRWWWLISDPDNPNGTPSQAFGPFETPVFVPSQDLLASNNLTHAGTWSILGRPCYAFSGRKLAKAGSWYWFDASSKNITRIMNVDIRNDFQVAILGAFYFVDLSNVETLASSNLREVDKVCTRATSVAREPSAMVTLLDILKTVASPPSGSQIYCTMNQIQKLMPGISMAAGTIAAPSWTNRVNSECFMIGQDTYPYYCQVWYDWNRGIQVTVFVQKDDHGSYSQRFDEVLPKGIVGPAIVYSWNGNQWTPNCCVAGGAFVPMPVPNFVQAAEGKCRAVIKNNPHFGSVSIWTVALGDNNGRWVSNFWYWFNESNQGVVFSLAPASSLTIIDYQTFVQDGSIAGCILDNPCNELPTCDNTMTIMARSRPRFVPFSFNP